MDQPSGPPQTTATQTPAHRDMMFCHECHDEWYRDQHGLTCPECGSDFTEIIEENNDPREEAMHGHGDDHEPMPDRDDDPRPHPLHHHNPFRDPGDPDEDDIDGFHFQRLGPGRFAVTGTIHRSFSPQQLGRGDGGAGLLGGFASMLNGIIGGHRGPQQGQEGQGDRGQTTEGHDTPDNRGHRFHYTSGARLMPRDPNNPGPHAVPVDDINNMVIGIMAAFGEPAGVIHQGPDGQPHMHTINPLFGLLTQLMNPGSAQAGDFVFSQEALDHVITQLMEQTSTSNAPGPASQEAIDSLHRKKVSTDMLGSEGRAECSICMEEVHLGDEVSELPCKHWFHHACVAAWLGEHDTCPHCRQGITKTNQTQGQNQPPNPQNAAPSNAAEASASAANANANQHQNPDPNAQMSGSFLLTGDGTPQHPFIFPPPDHGRAHGEPEASAQSSQDEEAGHSGGLSDRIRRGLFGPHGR
ncbi:hypothetical protein CC78DRAFT_98760 [Lojkania enalia]|uniref:RING-type E3 ubiquitin transferase n=1 Tax=Lojkania enalia TaxID=147567 RepID=A0A9P4K208_9PLEO|nr:hypothetical protein CC78DRAFT_98760 [Didymosphaeria enalia]